MSNVAPKSGALHLRLHRDHSNRGRCVRRAYASGVEASLWCVSPTIF